MTVNLETMKKMVNADEGNTEKIRIGTLDGDKIFTECKTSLTMEDLYKVIVALSEIPIVKNEDGSHSYVPSSTLAAMKVTLIKCVCPKLELPDGIVEAYEMASRLNLWQKVSEVLKDSDMFNDILLLLDCYQQYHQRLHVGLSGLESMLTEFDKDNILKSVAEMTNNIEPQMADNVDG